MYMGKLINTQNNTDIIDLDYLQSDDPEEIDRGIRRSLMGVHISVLSSALGLAKVKTNKLFKSYGFNSMNAYIIQRAKEYNMAEANMRKWLKIGEAYTKYKSELDDVGFNEGHGLSKLRFLGDALSSSPKEEVYENIKSMSFDDFYDYAKGKKDKNAINENTSIEIRGNVTFINGKRAVIISNDLGKNATRFFKKLMEIGCESLNRGLHLMPVFLHNRREVERFRRMLPDILKAIRSVDRKK